MKLNKKILALMMSTMLTVPFVVGCNDNNVTEQLPETSIQQEQPNEQQEQPKVDEDLNNEYKQKASQKEQAEQAKLLIEQMASEHLSGYRWQVEISEDYQRVWLKFYVSEEQVKAGILDGSWYDLVEASAENTREGKMALERLGLNVDYGMMIGDIDRDSYWLGVVNGSVIYNVVDTLN